MMLYQIKSYLRFLFRSSNQHGVHSPFVYDLVTKCFYSKVANNNYQIFKNHRTSLLSDTSEISITDFGAGSRVFKSNERHVSAIAKNAGISLKRQRLLFRLAQYFQPKNTLELGTSLGMGTMALALGTPLSNITTIEGCEATSAKARYYFDQFSIKNIHLVTCNFEAFFHEVTSKTFDFIYVDGNHSKEATLDYFNILLNLVSNDSIIIFDDIYWSAAMTEAWQEIITNPKVTVSIDTFQWGIVFFRNEQPKQHFNIRV